MKISTLRNDRKPKLMIIPMIDIIFFLLVFFMMSTLYMVEQHTIPLNLPQASAQTVQTEDIRTTLVYEVRIYVEDPKDQLKMGQPVTVSIVKSADSAAKNHP